MTQKPHIAMIGDGNVGSALTEGLTRAGYDVRVTGKEPEKVREVATWGQVIVLAVPFGERENALREMGDAVDGKVLVDVTNALTPSYELAVDPRSASGAEDLQRQARNVSVVKAFNTVFAQHMSRGELDGESLTVFAASDDAEARKTVMGMAEAIGFDAVDAGPLANARWLETLGLLNIRLGYGVGMGPTIGFRLVHPAGSA